jgi:hypothetical protein
LAGLAATATLPNGLVTTYPYDRAQRLTNLTNVVGSTTITSHAYTLDSEGNRTAQTEFVSGITTGSSDSFGDTYDGLNRLTAVTTTNAETFTLGLARTDRAGPNPDGELSPLFIGFVVRAIDGARINLTYDTRAGLVVTPSVLPAEAGDVLADTPDPGQLLALVEDAGGRTLRMEWERALRGWTIRLSLVAQAGRPTATVPYSDASETVTFHVDVCASTVSR